MNVEVHLGMRSDELFAISPSFIAKKFNCKSKGHLLVGFSHVTT